MEKNKNTSWKALGEVIKNQRLKLNLSKKDLANKAKLPDDGTIALIERGEIESSEGCLKLLSDALNISLNTLLLVKEKLDINTISQSNQEPEDQCPFRGLMPFREQDSRIYFGRKSVVEKLRSKIDQNNLVGLVGASGSGKSSIVAAGLLPHLKETQKVLNISFRPGRHPFESLAVAITPFLVGSDNKFNIEETKKTADALRTGSGRLLMEKIRQDLNYETMLLLVIDQFEELFTQCDNLDIQKAFISFLTDLSKSQNVSFVGIRILITIRGDFFGHIVDNRELAEVLQDNIVYLPPMSKDELKDTIILPAKLFGVTVDDSLVERIIAEAGDEPGYMPLIQFCLSLLWKTKNGEKLQIKAYEEMGGLKKAVASQAERVYIGFGPEGKLAMRRLLSRLIRVSSSGGDGTETKRMLSMETISESQQEKKVIEALIIARLLTTDYDQIKREETVELAHEAIIRHWQRLKTWLIDDRQFLLWQQSVEPICEEWINSGKNESHALRGRLLEQGEAWDKSRLKDMQPNVREFLLISQKVKIREAAARSEELASFLLRAKPEDIPEIVSKLRGNKDWVKLRLKTLISEQSHDPNLWRLRIALVQNDSAQVSHILQHLYECEPNELSPLINVIRQFANTDTINQLKEILTNEKSSSTSILRVACALAQIDPSNSAIDNVQKKIARTVVEENPLHVLIWTNALNPVSDKLEIPLREILINTKETNEIRDASALVLQQLLSTDPVKLSHVATESSSRVFERFYAQLSKFSNSRKVITSNLLNIATDVLNENANDENEMLFIGKRRALAAILNLRFEEFSAAQTIFNTREDPEAGTQFVHNCNKLKVNPNLLASKLLDTEDSLVWYWLSLAIGEYDISNIEKKIKNNLVDILKIKYRDDPSPTVHGVVGWLLNKWSYTAYINSVDEQTHSGTFHDAPNWFTLAGPCGPIPFVKIPIGKFKMGSALTEKGAKQYETPVRDISITRPYALCCREITREEYHCFENEAGIQGLPEITDFSPAQKNPVVAITWDEGLKFISWLENKLFLKHDMLNGHTTKSKLRLPTEAEWEHACRSGTSTAYYFGSDRSLLKHHAWYHVNSDYQTNLYRTKPPNQFGLFNMHGNCWEWCSDFYNSYDDLDNIDPNGLIETDWRVLRGGCWNLDERYSRSACRNWHVPYNRNYYIGLRIALGES